MPKNDIFIRHSIKDLINGLGKTWTEAELLQGALDNITELDPKYLAWVCYKDTAWKSPGKGAPTEGYLAEDASFRGIPIGVKDIYNTYDFPTEMGSPLWKGHMPGNDARALYNLKHTGAVAVGKTVTAEFAVHALESTLNPWDVKKTPGTSSSGSAVAVTTGMVPFATGSQTAGSIIRPSSFTGIYGFKPSFGLIPRTGTLKTTDSLDTLGFMAIHLEDIRRGFEAMRVHGADYPKSHRAINDPLRKKPSDRPWKIAFAKTHTWDLAPQYARDAITKLMNDLSNDADFEIVDSELPVLSLRSHEIHETIYNKSLSYYFKGEHKKSDFVSKVMVQMIESGTGISVEAYRAALEDQMQLIQDMDRYLSDVDVMISLSTSGEAPQREVTEIPDPSLMWTLAHLPALNVPVFRSPTGLPFGFQVTARKYNDYAVLDLVDSLCAKGLAPTKAGFAVSQSSSQ